MKLPRGIGGSDQETEWGRLANTLRSCLPISVEEYHERLTGLRARMQRAQLDAVWLDAGSNLLYYTGTSWSQSERLMGALVPAQGPLIYVGPAFEESTIQDCMGIEADLHVWQEDESPFRLVASLLPKGGPLGLDPSMPYFRVCQMQGAFGGDVENAEDAVLYGRARKSAAEIALLQAAKTATLEVHRACARVLRVGITPAEVIAFIDQAHQIVGAPGGAAFGIVLFGPDTAFPHGVAQPKPLEAGDMVVIDTGCTLHGYQSDITRSYVFGEATERQRQVWVAERACQEAAFQAAQIGASCASVDAAARAEAARHGFGPGYTLPGIPHRTGHGIGLDIHEGPYLVASDQTALEPGMCFSNEPMICVPGEFGVRLEDHFYMTAGGPQWFTNPASSIDDPFGSMPDRS